MSDVAERKLWHRYMAAYQDAIRETSRREAPWYVVPADHKPLARLVVAKILIEKLEKLDLKFPRVEGTGSRRWKKCAERCWRRSLETRGALASLQALPLKQPWSYLSNAEFTEFCDPVRP